MEYLYIRGEPDQPLFVELLCAILLFLNPNILPIEKDNLFPFGYCNINVSLFTYFLYSSSSLSVFKNPSIPSSSNISIHV